MLSPGLQIGNGNFTMKLKFTVKIVRRFRQFALQECSAIVSTKQIFERNALFFRFLHNTLAAAIGQISVTRQFQILQMLTCTNLSNAFIAHVAPA